MAEVRATAAAPAAKTKPAPTSAVKKAQLEDRVHVWPFLVRNEFICTLIVMVLFTVWSIVINAPLEEPANPANTPNPSKAPWYFLGLQEMLVYFDPWMAGVVLPSLVIVGLMLIPYVDINPKGSGYYTFRERPFAITTFLFGFLILWVTLILLGVFFRGPGWNLFWPWDRWDPHKVVALTNVDLASLDIGGTGLPFKWLGNPKIFGVELIGLTLSVLYLGVLPVVYYLWKKPTSPTLQTLGPVRYAIVVQLFLIMMSLPLKMFLRIAFNIKYVWITPWFNI
ncbi:MAG: cytochrome C [candidate division NC10 bacterium RIFCSPLOWO2_02_FULL_66_22]|nr:MAG: cytochrome C [candidate division NC10 bacterium RIFCSPLOWO2_02_FULL_66_22]